LHYAVQHSTREGIAMNKSQCASDFRLAVDQGFPQAKHTHRCKLYHGHGIETKKSQFAYYLKLVADQGVARAQFCYGFQLFEGCAIGINKS
jgi:TPR repeat protein